MARAGRKRVVRIGCAAGFYGDTPFGAPQLVSAGIDYLVFDYLAEVTMAILAKARQRDESAGYAADFIDPVLDQVLADAAARHVRIIANAGGVNPEACAAAVEALVRRMGLKLTVGVVLGDNLMPQFETLARNGMLNPERFGSARRPISCNAYLGAFPIAAALAGGADIVITGRCVDSALALGPLIHEFGWTAEDLDWLAAGSLAGHLIECGPQVTGGLLSDWQDVASWNNIGFPIAECAADGGLVITKPAGTDGLVDPRTVGEQLVYEIGDPGRYLLPDVTVDLRNVRLRQIGPDRVEVSGVRGLPPDDSYKATVTWADGFRTTVLLPIVGGQARGKALRVAQTILWRARRAMASAGQEDFRRTSVEVIGAEDVYGPASRAGDTREVVLKLAVEHEQRDALALFGREVFSAVTSMAPGTSGFGGRPQPSPLIRVDSCLVPKAMISPTVRAGGKTVCVATHPWPETSDSSRLEDRTATAVEADWAGPCERRPLIALAYGRSGDKGDSCNIGIISRLPEFVPLLRAQLTAEAVAAYFAHLVEGPVQRFELPGIHGFNFLLERALGGGGTASLRYDGQGKGFAQMLMDLEIEVPLALCPLVRGAG